MADNAHVRSIEQMELFNEQLEVFRAQLLKEIDLLEVELRRVTQWLSVDAPNYWLEELVKSKRRVTECQDALVRCSSYVRADERRPCTEEKKRLEKARQRFKLCEDKLRYTKTACLLWETTRNKQRSKLQKCRDLAESGVTVALVELQGQIERLRLYAGLRSSAPSPSSDR
jgi:hypothetical protein